MDFDLSPELAALQESVRRLAQDKIKPRAREIDTTGEYPQDIFEAFRDADLLGLCLPTEVGGSGAGILGLTIAIEEVAKYSNSAALMLLLTRLPTGPVLIAGNDDQKQRYLPGIATGRAARLASGCPSPRPASTWRACGPGPLPDTRPGHEGDWVLTGTKCWMSGVVRGRLVHGVRQDRRPGAPGPRLDHRLHRRARLGRGVGRAHRPQDGGARASTPASCSSTRCASPRRT